MMSWYRQLVRGNKSLNAAAIRHGFRLVATRRSTIEAAAAPVEEGAGVDEWWLETLTPQKFNMFLLLYGEVWAAHAAGVDPSAAVMSDANERRPPVELIPWLAHRLVLAVKSGRADVS